MNYDLHLIVHFFFLVIRI